VDGTLNRYVNISTIPGNEHPSFQQTAGNYLCYFMGCPNRGVTMSLSISCKYEEDDILTLGLFQPYNSVKGFYQYLGYPHLERKNIMQKLLSAIMVIALSLIITSAWAKEIVHDAEYYILEKQNAERWANENKDLDKQLADFRKKNGGKSPNIFYILIDDIGFGDLGSETLNVIRGYKTPSINKFAEEGMRLARMYTEPSCTPTRVAFMTGRQPYRNGMGNTSVDISGFGLADEEVTLAEVLSKSGYNT
jgi:hypothetical protein